MGTQAHCIAGCREMKRIDAPLDFYAWAGGLTIAAAAIAIAPGEVGKLAANPMGYLQGFTRPIQEAIAPNPQQPTAASIGSPRVRAFLDVIAHAEGTAGPNGYRMMFGGKLFDDFSKHPRQCFRFFDRRLGRSNCSTAAGRYQILDRTFEQLGMKDFSPASQDKAAVALIQSKGALQDIEAGRIQEAIAKVRPIWASFPGAGYSQPEKPMGELMRVYERRLDYHQSKR